jgi:hypothetical protein
MATSKAGFSVPADKHAEVVKAQRDFMGLLAERIERGEPFARASERKLVAGILRAWAKQLPDTIAHAPDGEASIDPGYAAIHFACLVNGQGRTKAAAAQELAGLYGASAEDILAAIARYEDSAMRLVPRKA